MSQTNFVYQNADGSPRYKVVRTETADGKTFAQHGNRNGGFSPGMDGITPTLFNAPDLAKEKNRTVYFVEGEKHAQAMKEMGFTATTMSGGSVASNKWNDEHSALLRGKNVYLIPDNDWQGHQHMRRVAEKLLGVADSIHIIWLDGLPQKADILDFIAAGATGDDIKSAARNAAVVTPENLGLFQWLEEPAKTATPAPKPAQAPAARAAHPYDSREEREPVYLDGAAMARALGGDWTPSTHSILCPGPGHSKKDRSLSIKLDHKADGGFVVNSHANDDPIAAKDYVRDRCGLDAWEPAEFDDSWIEELCANLAYLEPRQAKHRADMLAVAQMVAASRFQWMTGAEFKQPILNGNWLIKGVMPAEGLGVLFGKPGTGKSFMAMDMALRIALGLPWRGKKTRKVDVAYLASEAGRTGANRILSWAQHEGHEWPEGFRMSPVSLDLCGDVDAKALAENIMQNQPNCGLVVIDTLARNLGGGDENTAKDMGSLVNNMDDIAKATGALVLAVHHSGKDEARGARGHSSLFGAIGLEMEIRRNLGEPGTLKVTKLRDGEAGPEFGFDLHVVELGVDEDGDPVTSCVVISADVEDAKAASKQKPNGENQRLVANAFDQFVLDHGKPNPPGTGFPNAGQVLVVHLEAFMAFASAKFTQPTAGEKRKQCRRVLRQLVANGFFATNADCIWRVR